MTTFQFFFSVGSDEGLISTPVIGDVLNLFIEGGPRIVIELISNIYETEEWPKVYIGVAVTALTH